MTIYLLKFDFKIQNDTSFLLIEEISMTPPTTRRRGRTNRSWRREVRKDAVVT